VKSGSVPVRRVAMISVHTCPLATLGGKDTGGMNVYVRELTRELTRRGIGVDVFTRSQNPHLPHIVHELGPGGRVIHVPAGPEAPIDKHQILPYLSEFIEWVRRFAEREGLVYDVIHSHYWLSGLAALALRPIWRAPVIQMFHTLGKMKNRVARRAEEQEPPARLEAERRLVREADHLVAATPLEKAQLSWLYGATPSHITVIPPGVDVQRFRPIPKMEARRILGFPPERRYVLFVGRIEPLKGLETLMRAVAILAQDCPTWTRDFAVVVIGGDPDATADAEMQRLQQLREELGITDLIAFLGAKAQETLPYYYNAADVVVMPSDYESFGLVALEAMACGTPVIASDVGGLLYLVRDGETGLRVPRRQPIALARALDRLLRDEALRQRLGENARRWAQGFAWSIIADRVLNLYDEVLKTNRGRARPSICYGRWSARLY